MPVFQAPDPNLTKEQALAMILASIASEEMALSHLINAEGEKIQSVAARCASTDELIAFNRSAASLMEIVMQTQMLLKNKMNSVLDALPPPPPPPSPPPLPPPPTPPPCPAPPRPPCFTAAVFEAESTCWFPGRCVPLRPVCCAFAAQDAQDCCIILLPGGRYTMGVDALFSACPPPGTEIHPKSSACRTTFSPSVLRMQGASARIVQSCVIQTSTADAAQGISLTLSAPAAVRLLRMRIVLAPL